MSLFREEVFEREVKEGLGAVLITYPLSIKALSGIAFIIFTILISAIFFFSYTRHVKIEGVIEPDKGIIKIYAPQNGSISKLNIYEGKRIHQGDILVELKYEHNAETGNILEESINERLKEQIEFLNDELNSNINLQGNQADTLKRKIEDQKKTLDTLERQAEMQLGRLESSNLALERFKVLKKSGYVSDAQIEQKK